MATSQPEDEQPNPTMDALSIIDPDALTPRQALDELYRLKALADV
jgi:DNA mismatch repair protein MutS